MIDACAQGPADATSSARPQNPRRDGLLLGRGSPAFALVLRSGTGRDQHRHLNRVRARLQRSSAGGSWPPPSAKWSPVWRRPPSRGGSVHPSSRSASCGKCRRPGWETQLHAWIFSAGCFRVRGLSRRLRSGGDRRGREGCRRACGWRRGGMGGCRGRFCGGGGKAVGVGRVAHRTLQQFYASVRRRSSPAAGVHPTMDGLVFLARSRAPCPGIRWTPESSACASPPFGLPIDNHVRDDSATRSSRLTGQP